MRADKRLFILQKDFEGVIMSHVILITGGSRSGKSTYAEKLCLSEGSKLAYVATANIYDDEMKRRVELHKERRGEKWTSFEIPLAIDSYIVELSQYDYVLVDCLTMLILNKMFSLGHDLDNDTHITQKIYEQIENETITFINDYMNAIGQIHSNIVIVTNEIGLGIVPESKLSRLYRDIVGKANQILAAEAKEVFFVISGIPLKIKDIK